MKKRLLLSAAMAGLVSVGSAQAELSLNASLELDNDAVDTSTDDVTYDQNGFVELGAYGRHTSGEYFVSAAGVVRLTTDGDDHVNVQDVYVQLGNATWDAQFGRFEAINLFPLGKDTVVANAGGSEVSIYEANKVRGRAGDDGGQIALHYNASQNLKFELATIFGDDDTAGDNGTAVSGVRPVITYVTDGFSVSAGYERVSYDLSAGGDVDQEGFGLTTNFALGAASVNLSASYLEDDNSGDETNSYGANLVYGGFGAGLIYSELDKNGATDTDVTTAYLAYTLPLFDIEAASVTFAGSYSQADNVSTAVSDETSALRVRFNYTF